MWQIFNRSHVHEWKIKLKMYRVTANLCTELKNVTFNLVLQFPLIPQWNVEQDAWFQLFFEDDFFRSLFFKKAAKPA